MAIRGCDVSFLGLFDSVFAFLQLGDVELWLGAIQSFEPHLVVVDGGDDGAARHKTEQC